MAAGHRHLRRVGGAALGAITFDVSRRSDTARTRRARAGRRAPRPRRRRGRAPGCAGPGARASRRPAARSVDHEHGGRAGPLRVERLVAEEARPALDERDLARPHRREVVASRSRDRPRARGPTPGRRARTGACGSGARGAPPAVSRGGATRGRTAPGSAAASRGSRRPEPAARCSRRSRRRRASRPPACRRARTRSAGARAGARRARAARFAASAGDLRPRSATPPERDDGGEDDHEQQQRPAGHPIRMLRVASDLRKPVRYDRPRCVR